MKEKILFIVGVLLFFVMIYIAYFISYMLIELSRVFIIMMGVLL